MSKASRAAQWVWSTFYAQMNEIAYQSGQKPERNRGIRASRKTGRVGVGDSYQLEALEPRVLLSALADYLDIGNAAAEAAGLTVTTAPDDGGGQQPGSVTASPDPDLKFLAQHSPVAELPVLDKVGAALLTLYSRSLQGQSASTDHQQIGFTPFNDFYNTREGIPHVQAFVKDVAAARPALEAMGMQVTAVTDTDDWQVVAGYLPVTAVGQAAHTPGLVHLAPTESPYLESEPDHSVEFEAFDGGSGGTSGAGVNEWDDLSGAAQLRRVLTSVTGGGIDVGVMSDSINRVGGGVATSQASGDLPPGGRVNILADFNNPGATDEGRAMAELVYDLAPDFDIIYHTATVSPADMAQGIVDLRNAGADVITDDISWFQQPYFQDGPIAQAVDNLAPFNIPYFSAAGNRNGESYLSFWSDTNTNGFHNFTAGDETIDLTLSNNEQLRVFLQWDDPWGNAATDIDIELWDATRTTKLADSNTNNIGGNPFDALFFTNNTGSTTSFELSYRWAGGTDPAVAGRMIQMAAPQNDDDFTDPYVNNQPGVFGHKGTETGFGIGAVPWNNPTVIEGFSSHGPRVKRRNDAGVFTGTVNLQQPVLTAADGTETTVPGFINFFGTSAAAPNAAAVAGLMIEAAGGSGSLSHTQIRQIMIDTAVGTGTGAWDDTHGNGRINALGAGLVADGIHASEFSLELNQFGNKTFSSNLFANNDIDGLFFAQDTNGSTTISATESNSAVDLGAILWNSETDNFIEIDYDTINDDPQFNRSLSLWTLYQVELFAEEDLGANTPAVYTLTVDAPSPVVTSVTLNANGNNTQNQAIGNQDADYFMTTAPITSNGALTLTVTPGPALDSVVSLFNAAGTELARVDTGSLGAVDVLTFNGIVPGDDYYFRVGSQNYASADSYSLDIEFGLALPLEFDPANVEGFATIFQDGTSRDVQSFGAFMDFVNDTDSYFFASDSSGTVDITVDDLGGAVNPVVAVYNGTTGAILGFDDDSGPGNDALLSLPLTAFTRYIVVVADDNGVETGDVAIEIDTPTSQTGENVPINADGIGALTSRNIGGADSDFFRFTLPANATGSGVVTITPTGSETLDPVVVLFDAAGNDLDRGTSALVGQPSVMSFNGLAAGTEYFLTVHSDDYNFPGDFLLDIQLDLFGEIRGVKFADENGDGVQDPGEIGLPGWTMYLDENRNGVLDVGEPSTVTSANGQYVFTNVPPGQGYVVAEVPQTGWTQTSPSLGVDEAISFLSTDLTGADELAFLIPPATTTLGATVSGHVPGSFALDHHTQTLYSISILGVQDTLVTVDTLTGDATPIGTGLGAGFNNAGVLAFDASTGVLYSVNLATDELLRIDPVTGLATTVGSLGFSGIGSLAYDPLGDVLYGVDFLSQELITIDRTTGAGTLVGNTGANYRDLAFDPVTNTLFGLEQSTFEVWTINTTTAATASFAGPFSNSSTNSFEVLPRIGTRTAVVVGNGDIVTGMDFGNQPNDLDLGDAPAPYPTLLADDGARHAIVPGGPVLGASIDRELDGLPSALADGDDLDEATDDEDGVVFLTPLSIGSSADIEVTVSDANGLLSAWIDFNLDGDWADPGEQIFTDQPVVVGSNPLSFAVPVSGSDDGSAAARFRIDSFGGLSVTGLAGDGEVEDYLVVIENETQPFVRLEPLGGLMFESQDSVGILHSASDQDDFNLFLEGDQTLAAVVSPADPGVTLSVELMEVGGPVLATATAAGPGDDVVLSPTAVPVDGVYQVRVSGDGSSQFNLDLFRNASLELEAPTGDTGVGNELAIDASQILLGNGSRFGVVGSSDPGVVTFPIDQRVLYGASNESPGSVAPSNLYRINPATGLSKLIGPIGFDNVTGLTFLPDGRLVGSANGDALFNDGVEHAILIEIDPETGQGTLIGEIDNNDTGDAGRMPDLTFDPFSGTLFGYSNNPTKGLYKIDPISGDGDLIGPTGFIQGGNGLDVDPISGRFFATPADNRCLIEIDPSDGSGSAIECGNVPEHVNALDFHPDTGVLYGSWLDQSTGTDSFLVAINTVDGTPTVIGSTVAGLDALAWGPAEESTTQTDVIIAAGSESLGCEETGQCLLPTVATIGVGGQVTWHNTNSAAHTVTSGTLADGVDGVFDSGLMPAGAKFSHRFTQAGQFPYFDLVHPWIQGVVNVLGPVTYSESFDSGLGGFTIDNSFGSGNGFWHQSTGRQLDGAPNHSPPGSLYYGQNETDFAGGDYNTPGLPNGGAATSPTISLPANAQIGLSFQSLIEVEAGFELLDVVVNHGASSTRLLSTFAGATQGNLPSDTGGQWERFDADLSDFAGQDITIAFTFETQDSFANFFEGWFIDDIVVTSVEIEPDVDLYTLDLTGLAGRRIDVALAGQGAADFSGQLLELLDTDGSTVLATAVPDPLGVPAVDFDLGILDFVVPADGVYSLRLTSTVEGQYGAVVTEQVLVKAASTRRLDPLVGQAVGFLDGTGGDDVYEVHLTVGDTLTLSTQTLFDDTMTSPFNDLDPKLMVELPSGGVAASDSNSAADGKNALLSLVATETGVYRVAVGVEAGSGEYLLNAEFLAPPRVVGVQAVSTAWTAPALVGGFAIPVGNGDQHQPLPWGNIDQVKIIFSEDVGSVNDADFDLTGLVGGSQAFTASYDPVTFTATLNFTSVLDADAFTLTAFGTITDSSANALDGEWDNPTDLLDPTSDTYPSGDGTAGGAFVFRFNVLPGDANQDGSVSIGDFSELQNNFNQPGSQNDGDFNGDGLVTFADFAILQNHFNQTVDTTFLSPLVAGDVGVTTESRTGSVVSRSTDRPLSRLRKLHHQPAIRDGEVRVASGQGLTETRSRRRSVEPTLIALGHRAGASAQPKWRLPRSMWTQPMKLRHLMANEGVDSIAHESITRLDG